MACALLVAGCGGEERAPAPKLPRALAERLATRSDAVAELLQSGEACAARTEAGALQAEAIAAVNGRRVPGPFQEQLLGSVTALVESIECGRTRAGDGEDGQARTLANWLRRNAA